MNDWASEFDAHAAFMRLYATWRKKDGMMNAQREYAGILASAGPHAPRQAELIQTAAEVRVREYKRANGADHKFDKRLANWLRDGDFLDDIADEPSVPDGDAASAMLRRIGL